MQKKTYHWDVSGLVALKNQRVFLTGGTGFFGKWLLHFFVETADALGVEAVVLSRNPVRFRNAFPALGCAPNISFAQGDVRSFEYPAGGFDCVVHAAAPIGSENIPYDSDEMYSILVEGTERVLTFATHAGAKRLLYVSSGAVYGIQPPDVPHIKETEPCSPVNTYGRGKLRAERMCMEREIDVVVARCFAFVGEYLQLDARYAIGNFILDCLYGRPIEIKGDGTPLRSYMHGADLAGWLAALLARGKVGEAYNVGSDQAVSIAALAHAVKRALGAQSGIAVQTPADLAQQPSRYVPSVQKAIDGLGLSMQVGLEEAIRSTAGYWQEREDVL